MKNTFHQIIEKICKELDIEFNLLSKDWVIMLKKNEIIKFISGYKFDLNSYSLGNIFDDKYATYEVLKKLNINIIEHEIVYGINNKNSYAFSCNKIEYVNEIFNKYDKNVVLKINDGTCGNNVYHIENINELEKKYKEMSNKYNSLSLCPYYEIDNEFRAIVLDNEIKVIYKKEKPLVIGDGISTIKELLVKFNPTYFEKIKDEKLDIVLENKKEYLYDWKFNLSRGAKMSEYLNEIDKEEISKIVYSISKKLNLGFCSVDIIKSNNKYYVLEINSGVMMKNYINQSEQGYIKAYNIYKEAIIKMFKEK